MVMEEDITQKISPEDLFKIGDAFLDRANYTRAIEYFSRVIKLDPKNARAYWNRAVASEMNGDIFRASEDYHRAHELDSNMLI